MIPEKSSFDVGVFVREKLKMSVCSSLHNISIRITDCYTRLVTVVRVSLIYAVYRPLTAVQ